MDHDVLRWGEGEGKRMQHQTPSAVRADHRRGRISLAKLGAGQQERMRASLRAIAGRTISLWEEVAPSEANVLVLEADTDATHRVAAITLWIGGESSHDLASHDFQLPKAFSAHELWSVLDRISVRLMDMPTTARPVPPECRTAEPPVVADAAQPARAESSYRLLRWVTLEPPLHELCFRRAMAAMTRRDATLRWLVDHGGLEHEDARLLLRTLNRLGVLQINVGASAVPVVPVQPPQAKATVHSHFFNVVARWLQGSRRQLRAGS